MARQNPVDERARCKATNRAGGRCKLPPIPGGVVCRMHGGAAPQVKQKAQERLAALVDPAITALNGLLAAEDEKARLGAVKDVLDRTGFGAKQRHEISGRDGGPIEQEVRTLVDDSSAQLLAELIAAGLGARPGDPAQSG